MKAPKITENHCRKTSIRLLPVPTYFTSFALTKIISIFQGDGGASAMLVTMTSNGGSASDATGEGEDMHDGAMNQAPVDENRKRQTIEQLKKKIDKTNRLINEEQNAKEGR